MRNDEERSRFVTIRKVNQMRDDEGEIVVNVIRRVITFRASFERCSRCFSTQNKQKMMRSAISNLNVYSEIM